MIGGGAGHAMTGYIMTGPEYRGMSTGHGIIGNGGGGSGGGGGNIGGCCGMAAAMVQPLQHFS